MVGSRSPGRLSVLSMMLFGVTALQASADGSAGQVSAADIDQSVISSLPTLQEKSAGIVQHLDLTGAFETKGHWTFVAAVLPGSHLDGASEEPVAGGPLARCFVNDLSPHCIFTTPSGDMSWFSTPIELYAAEVVFRGENNTLPLLLVKAGSAHGGDGGHSIYTELFAYYRQVNEFKSVFSNVTGSNNNQQTRFVKDGPLRGDVIVDEPSGCCYRVEVFRQGPSGRYARILAYRSSTVYGDGNPLSVSDSEMPEIMRRLGIWHQGDPLPIPHPGCAPVMRRGEEWCE